MRYAIALLLCTLWFTSLHADMVKYSSDAANEPQKTKLQMAQNDPPGTPAVAKSKGKTAEGADKWANFKGRKIVIEGQLFLQANDSVLATGGASGTRIVVDNSVFLRDDDSLDPSLLYRVPKRVKKQPSEKKSAPKPTAVAISQRKPKPVIPKKMGPQASNRQIVLEIERKLARRAKELKEE